MRTAIELASARMGKPVDQTKFDRAARELYSARSYHGHGCWRLLTLADRLGGSCPACGGLALAGPDITLSVGRAMLRELALRRRELGIET
ncbi:MAG: hypothetical protein JXA14_19230 [Anaerolineae bacterium]|nr:hypothetical protein [Anaerolineae bacterium]